MPQIRIRVTASVDSNLASIFTPITTAAKKARKTVAEELNAGAAEGFGPYRTQAGRAAQDTEKVGKAAKATQQSLGALADGSREKFSQLSHGLQKLPADLRTVASEAQRELAKIERAQARVALGIAHASPGSRSYARGMIQMGLGGNPISSWARGMAPSLAGSGGGMAAASIFGVAGRIGRGALSIGTRTAADMLSGIGVNTDLASMFGEQTKLQTLATGVSNFGYMPNDPRNKNRVDSGELVNEARSVGLATATDPTQMLEGLQKFVGKTGDLQTGRDAMMDLAKLSKASGANLAEMVDAAGDVSNVLGDIPDKGKMIYEVMKHVAGEGKTGAVLIKDLATQMAKVASSAMAFEGGRSQNIGILTALAEEARGKGGAASATQAATAVRSFTSTFDKGAREEAFRGFHVQTRGATGGIRNAEDVIVDSLNASMSGGTKVTKGGHVKSVAGGLGNFNENLYTMFADERAKSAVRGFATTYRETYAGTKGTDQERMAAATRAVREEFERLTSSVMSEQEVQKSFERAMGTTESKVTQFNIQMAATAGQVEGALLPALMDLAPEILNIASAAATFAEWVTGQAGKKGVEDGLKGENVILTGADAARKGKVLTAGAPTEDEVRAAGFVPGVSRDGSEAPFLMPAPLAIPEQMPAAMTAEQQTQDAELAKKRAEFKKNLDVAEKTATDEPTRKAIESARKGDYSGLQGLAGQESPQSQNMAMMLGRSGTTATSLLEQVDALAGAGRTADMTKQIADAFKEALRSGAIEVKVVNPKEFSPPKATTADTSSQQGADSGT